MMYWDLLLFFAMKMHAYEKYISYPFHILYQCQSSVYVIPISYLWHIHGISIHIHGISMVEAVCMASHAFFESHFGFVDSGCHQDWTFELQLLKGHLVFKVKLSWSASKSSWVHKTKMRFEKSVRSHTKWLYYFIGNLLLYILEIPINYSNLITGSENISTSLCV